MRWLILFVLCKRFHCFWLHVIYFVQNWVPHQEYKLIIIHYLLIAEHYFHGSQLMASFVRTIRRVCVACRCFFFLFLIFFTFYVHANVASSMTNLCKECQFCKLLFAYHIICQWQIRFILS